ncbi:MAG: hypothetical protein KZQ98_20070 [Candidatus Thiodiazotropha sp. (ex Lucinoma borealis)]|nr:hypothetical protein [Candidatus Thiodiazotropha sp. (ex Lucinoma borealis)]
MSPDDAAYLYSWSNELMARADRVRQLIGDAHWLSDGHHKESLIREFLGRYLPNNLSISTGFVRATGQERNCSPEIDILILDPAKHPPFFNEGGLSIVPPSSVVAHYEIKTMFTKQSLSAALTTIAETQLILTASVNPENIWRCACFYETPGSRTSESIEKTLRETISEIFNSKELELPANTSINLASLLPTCISTMDGYVIFFVPDGSKYTCSMKIFDAKGNSLACSIADMFGSIRRYYGGPVVGELDDMIESLSLEKPLITTIGLNV